MAHALTDLLAHNCMPSHGSPHSPSCALCLLSGLISTTPHHTTQRKMGPAKHAKTSASCCIPHPQMKLFLGPLQAPYGKDQGYRTLNLGLAIKTQTVNLGSGQRTSVQEGSLQSS